MELVKLSSERLRIFNALHMRTHIRVRASFFSSSSLPRLELVNFFKKKKKKTYSLLLAPNLPSFPPRGLTKLCRISQRDAPLEI